MSTAKATDMTLSSEQAIDPVCGMTVNTQTAAGSLTHKGTTYFFCSAHCVEAFRKDPERFLNPAPVQLTRKPTAAPIGNVEYTCPMHPEIVRDHPGSCPICGMALEPRTVSLDDQENPELVDMTRRFWVSAVLTLPLLLVGMSEFLPGHPLERLIPMHSLGWIELVLAT